MSGPTYTYTPDVPQAAQPFNQTQSPILNNFRAINEYVGVNHIGFNTQDSGKHSFLSLPFQADDPGTASTDIALFTQQTPSGPNLSELFYQNPNNGIVTQLSNSNTPTSDTTIPAGTSGTGWCQFANSGMIMKWGQATVTVAPQLANYSNELTAFTLPTGSGIPVYQQAIFYCTINLLTNSSGSNPYSALGCSSFYGGNRTTTYIFLEQISTSSITITFNWFTIGI